MQYAELTERAVDGLSCRTSHAEAGQDIGALWEKVAASGLLEGHGRAVAVYHDYDVGPEGYQVTVTVGREASGDAVPEGAQRVRVPTQRCAVWKTDGSVPEVVAVWQKVWEQWPDGGPRSFGADVEIWEQSADGKPHAATVYVGVRG